MNSDLIAITQWWFVIFILGLLFFPISAFFFQQFPDKGYSFSKVFSIAGISYTVFLLGIVKLLPFTILTIFSIIGIVCIVSIFIFRKIRTLQNVKNILPLLILEELLFFVCLCFWSYIRAHQPNIHGLEKYMDYGFVNSILKSTYFPPADMWFTPFSINYYYFGHFVTALLTKISFLPSSITYNLMIATLCAFSFILPFSFVLTIGSHITKALKRRIIFIAILAGLLVAFSGNLHTLYTFFKPYHAEEPKPFWQLETSVQTFPNSYWYPNATRYIPFTIHEFPSYSFIVSDLHGHVLDIPFVFLLIALSYTFFIEKKTQIGRLIIISILLAILYMTNAWDGLIYMGLVSLCILLLGLTIVKVNYAKSIHKKILGITFKLHPVNDWQQFLIQTIKYIGIIVVGFIVFSLPFNIHFKPFVSGIGVLCAPEFLTKIGHIGPLLFEADHCQRSPLIQIIVLYGFFYFFVFAFLIFILRKKGIELTKQDAFILILIALSTLLIITPEFIYVKDIYPAHYRANTMFKLTYQAFMMLSTSSAYILFRILQDAKPLTKIARSFYVFFILASFFLIILVMIYPYFGTQSYYEELKKYKGLDGVSYLKTLHPSDYETIAWIDKNIDNQPVILEAQGDSYTDYGRISSNTGLPTVLGWTVHEWLWRGTYDIPSPRIEEIKIMYESEDVEKTRELLQKYKAEYVHVGGLEKEKYPALDERKFENLGKEVFKSGSTKLYKLAI